jgi:lipopolysaccharide transport system permease protein
MQRPQASERDIESDSGRVTSLVRELPRSPEQWRRTTRTVIEPRRPGLRHRARELWRYRSLLRFFARQFVERRYRRTVLGWLWLPLRPMLAVGSRVLIFGALLAIPSNGIPYLLFFLVGYGTWHLFSSYLMYATRALEMNRKLLRKLYFPRLVLLVAASAPAAIEFVVYTAMAAVAITAYSISDDTAYVSLDRDLLLVPAGLALVLALAFSIGLFTSVFGARARDVRFSLGYVLGFWLYLTPVIYPLSAVPERFHLLAGLNPMTAPVEMVKAGLLGAGDVQTQTVVISVSIIALTLVSGLWFFGRMEASSVDHL